MSEVKIGVGANTAKVEKAIDKITASINKMGAAVAQASKVKFEPVDAKYTERDLARINKQFEQAIKQSAALRNALKNSGQTGRSFAQVDWSKLSIDPATSARMRERAFRFSTEGTAWDLTNFDGEAPAPGGGGRGGRSGADGGGGGGGGGGGRRPPPGAPGDEERPGGWGRRIGRGIGRAAASFGSGAGGGAAVAGGAISAGIDAGVGAAAEGAGVAGIAGVAGPAAAAFVALEAMKALGKVVSEGIDLAKDQNNSVDLLKREMGDLGVSFDGLTKDAAAFSKGLGLSTSEFAKLELTAEQASGGAYSTPEEVARDTRSGADLARAYGIDPSQGVGFVAGMRQINSRQSNKELAVAIAEAIGNSQGRAAPGAVMQAMMAFASSQNRFNSGNVDLDRFGNAFSSLVGSGLTADHASSILGTANSAIQQMGGSEAARNFTMQAFGTLDPIRAQMRAEGGLFGNGLNSERISAYMAARGVTNWDAMDKGPAGDNVDVINKRFDDIFAGRGAYGREMELDAQKNYWHLKSYDDTAAFVNMSTSDHNGIKTILKNAGVDLGDVREGGLQALTGISRATSVDGLQKLYDTDISQRKDLTDSDRDVIGRALKTGDFDTIQNALTRVIAGKGQSDDAATDQREIDSTLKNIESDIGGKLIPYTQAMMHGILAIANKLPGVDIADPTMMGAPSDAAPGPAAADGGSRIARSPFDGLHTDTGGTAWDSAVDAGTSAFIAARRSVYGTRLSGLEQQYGLPSGLMMGVWGAETSFGANNKTSSAGAQGNFQAMPDTQKQYGIKIGDFSSESDGAARQLRDLLKKHHGDLRATLFDYNGVVHNTAAGEKYVNDVMRYGDMGGAGSNKLPSPANADIVQVAPKQAPEKHTNASSADATQIAPKQAPGKLPDITAADIIQIAPKQAPERHANATDAGITKIVPKQAPERHANAAAGADTKAPEKLPNVTAADIIQIAPEKIPANQRAANSSGSSSSGGGTASQSGDTPGDIVINFEQHNTNSSGQKKTTKLNTKVPIPTAQGLRAQQTIVLPSGS